MLSLPPTAESSLSEVIAFGGEDVRVLNGVGGEALEKEKGESEAGEEDWVILR